MPQPSLSRHISEFPRPASVSFATLRWDAEEEVTDEPFDDDNDETHTYTQEKTMFSVVGEHHRPDATEAAALAIAEEGTFLPARFWLSCDEDNPHDANAVSVHAIAQEFVCHVGFLPRHEAELYRQSLRRIGRPNETVEIVGCLTQGKDKPHPKCRLFLPTDFAAQLEAGVADSPSHNPTWLRNPDPVERRPFQGINAAGFTDDELRKIFCRYAKRKRTFGLPHHCDAAVESYRSKKMAEELEEFLLDARPAMPTRTEPSRELAKPGKSRPRDGVPARKRGESPRSRPAIVAEEQIDLPGAVLERPHGSEYGVAIDGRVSLTMLRRTSATEDGVDVQGILRFEIYEGRRRTPSIVEIALTDMFGVLEGIYDAVMAVAARVNQPTNVAITVPLNKKVAIVIRMGERKAWSFRSQRIDPFLRFGATEYLIIQYEQFVQSLARAAGAEQSLQEQIDLILKALRMPMK